MTGRRTLTRYAYADDRHLRSRQEIFAYAEAPADPGWRISPVPWDGTQIVADVGCGNGFDLRQLVPGHRCRHAFGLDLSAGMLRSLEDLRRTGKLSLIQADAQRISLRDDSVDVALAMHMLYHVPDIPAALRELRRIVKPGGLVLASTNSDGTLAEVHDLLDAAVSDHLGRPARVRPALGFTTETGGAILAAHFPDITLHRHEVRLTFPSAQPVLAYLGSIREPVISQVGEPLDFDAVLGDVAARIERVIRVQGCFRASARSGVFACR